MWPLHHGVPLILVDAQPIELAQARLSATEPAAVGRLGGVVGVEATGEGDGQLEAAEEEAEEDLVVARRAELQQHKVQRRDGHGW